MMKRSNTLTKPLTVSAKDAIPPDQEIQLKLRANEIFKNIFQEVFITNCGNPIDFE